MGWLELQGWIRAINRHREGGEPDPEKWTPASRDNFQDLDAQRRALRGQ
jgi:hypothetical protein